MSEVFVPSIALGELYYGARRSNRPAENQADIDDFIVHTRVLVCDLETAREYGRIKERLARRGRPISENDIWIAALAIQHDLTLITRDAHFHYVEGLNRDDWLSV